MWRVGIFYLSHSLVSVVYLLLLPSRLPHPLVTSDKTTLNLITITLELKLVDFFWRHFYNCGQIAGTFGTCKLTVSLGQFWEQSAQCKKVTTFSRPFSGTDHPLRPHASHDLDVNIWSLKCRFDRSTCRKLSRKKFHCGRSHNWKPCYCDKNHTRCISRTAAYRRRLRIKVETYINSLTFLKMSRNLLISKSNLFRTWWLYQTLMTIYSTGSGRPTGCSWPLAVFFHSL